MILMVVKCVFFSFLVSGRVKMKNNSDMWDVVVSRYKVIWVFIFLCRDMVSIKKVIVVFVCIVVNFSFGLRKIR